MCSCLQECVDVVNNVFLLEKVRCCWQVYVLSAEVYILSKSVCLCWKNLVLLSECHWLDFFDAVRCECYCWHKYWFLVGVCIVETKNMSFKEECMFCCWKVCFLQECVLLLDFLFR